MQAAIRVALARIQGTLRELVVRNRSPARIYLLDLPELAEIKRNVVLLPREKVKGVPNDKEKIGAFASLTGPPPTSDDLKKWLVLQPGFSRANRKCIERAVIKMLQRLQHFRGELIMRARFGTMVLWSYKNSGNSNPTLEEYFQMLQNSQTIGEVQQLYVPLFFG